MKSTMQYVGTPGGLVRRLGLGLCALALAGASAVAVAAPVLTTSYSFSGAVVTLNVNAVDVTDLYAYQFDLKFDSNVLSATTVTEGVFLAPGGSTFFDGGMIDNSTGLVSFVFNTLLGPGPGVDGYGVLATISFDVLQPAITTVDFSNVFFLNSAGDVIDVDVRSGVLAVPEPTSALLVGVGLFGLLATTIRRNKPLTKQARGNLATA